MGTNELDTSRVRELNGTSKSGWRAANFNLAPDLLERVDKIATDLDVPRAAVLVYAVEQLVGPMITAATASEATASAGQSA